LESDVEIQPHPLLLVKALMGASVVLAQVAYKNQLMYHSLLR
jgi:hypothetical protein